jgi:hypothetical protein
MILAFMAIECWENAAKVFLGQFFRQTEEFLLEVYMEVSSETSVLDISSNHLVRCPT